MSTETDAQLAALKEEIAAVRAENEKAWTLARDCYNALVNAKTVGTNGKLGALSGADTLAGAPVGDAAAVRSAIGALGNSDSAKFESISLKNGVETPFVDWHKMSGDDKDYQCRMICEVDGKVDAYGTFNFFDLKIGNQSLGDYAKNNVNFNTYGSVVQKLIGDVISKGFGAGTLCQSTSMNSWDGNSDNIYVTGTWMCTSQVHIPSEGKWLCTFIKCGN